MTRLFTRFTFLLAIATFLGTSAKANIVQYTTSFDSPTFSSGNLSGQDDWEAQTQWQVDGTGNITNTSGAFIRAHNTGVVGSTDIGEVMEITTNFTLSAFQTPSNDIASFEEGIFIQGMSDEVGVANFPFGLAAGLFYDVGTGNLELRANQGLNETGTTNAVVADASTLTAPTNYSLFSRFTKLGVDSWNVVVTLDDGTNVFTLDYNANGQDSNLDMDPGGNGILAGIQALPSSAGTSNVATPPFGSLLVSDFSLSIISQSVPEPGSVAMFACSLVAVFGRRRK
ncbi:MAG: PEP-CTERM sorting domain-containing protein [Planctomycetota bacterium]